MRIRMKRLAAGPAGTLELGKIYDRPQAEADALISAGAAESAEAPAKAPAAEDENAGDETRDHEPAEFARRNPPEQALSRRGRSRSLSGE